MPRTAQPQAQLESTDPNVKKPRLIKLIIKNYRCIGSQPVEIDLDDIVVLVGPNNVGKSSILKAYKLAMSQGSNKSLLEIDDFPGSRIDSVNLPEIEVHTVVYDETVGQQWIDSASGEKVVREKWKWHEVGAPKRYGWDTTLNNGDGDWSNSVPWGAPNVANSRRPEPHRVDAFASPDEQAKAIQSLLSKVLTERVKSIGEHETHGTNYTTLLESIKQLQKSIVDDAQEEIDAVNQELSSLVSKVFSGYKIDFDAKPEDQLDKTVNLFKADSQLLMGPADGHMSTIDKQGSGARRTLLWTALKFIAESTKPSGSSQESRPNLLLIDEPEICLHPAAIRDACKALYELPETGRWQVMATTHSPVFIDFSRDNTTIVRVEKDINGAIKGTTVFRPEQAQLDADDKTNLKLLNICDAYVAEFFFGGRIVVVEGDTEYTAFNYIRAKHPEFYVDVHIIRARGKATIRSLVKILNHFGANYAVLHDSDGPIARDGRTNPAWTTNQLILDAVSQKPESVQVRLLASLPNFERAYFGTTSNTEKPYAALKALMDNENSFSKVKLLFDSLLDFSKPVPENCIEWGDLKELESALEN
jgi:putative ATP-dependent endonuclease of OLD family